MTIKTPLRRGGATGWAATLAAACALGAAGSLAWAATPADAYYLSSTSISPHTNVFRFPPRAPAFRPCISKGIKVPRGQYLHGAYIVHLAHRTDPDRLDSAPITVPRTAWYTWEACRGWNRFTERYEVRATLKGPGVSDSILNEFTRDTNIPLTRRSRMYGNGNYEWGGRLARYVPGITEPSG